MNGAMTSRTRVNGTSANFIVSDLHRSLDFYKRLGFVAPGVWGDPPCFAMARRGDFEIMLHANKGPNPQPNGPHDIWDLYVRVTDLESEIAALKEGGVEIARGPCTQEYQMREIEVIDPDGHRICFAQDVS